MPASGWRGLSALSSRGLPDIPFISLEELFSEQGPELVLSLVNARFVQRRTPSGDGAQRHALYQRGQRWSIPSTIFLVLNPQRILKEMEGV